MIDRAWVAKVLRAAVSADASDGHFEAGEPVPMRIRGALRSLRTPKLEPGPTRQILQALGSLSWPRTRSSPSRSSTSPTPSPACC